MSRNGELKTFAYLLLACSWTPELESDLDDWYHGDIIEAFSECEDQAEEPIELWAFQWEQQMSRLAPVQLALGWDPRPYLRATLKAAGIEPEYSAGYCEEDDNVLYFARPPANSEALRCATDVGPDTRDKRRFDELLTATLELAGEQGRGLLFVGGEGWYYEMEVPAEVTPVLESAGFRFLTRHP